MASVGRAVPPAPWWPMLSPETTPSYYRARYYDPANGRFLSEDPIGFQGGGNFYRYVFNGPIRLNDPMGLSPQDVQRVQAACHKCTQQLVDAGLRQPGSGVLNGWVNDLKSWGGTKQACKSQAIMVQPCLEDPKPSYDSNWKFSVVPWWGGTHSVVVAKSSDPNDPLVYCDPWRNYTWTASNSPTSPPTKNGGGGW